MGRALAEPRVNKRSLRTQQAQPARCSAVTAARGVLFRLSAPPLAFLLVESFSSGSSLGFTVGQVFASPALTLG